MPRRDDLHKILLLGSGPIIIGQACEFDYSGTQACKALREEGYEVVLVNSNPASIMTDPEMANRTYIEPLTPDIVEKVIAKEKPDAQDVDVGGCAGNFGVEATAAIGVGVVKGVGWIDDAALHGEHRHGWVCGCCFWARHACRGG